MSDTPRISVVVAAYNQREYVLQTVESILNQTYPPHEVIVVDDGSNDGTADALRKLYPTVRVHVQENRGKCVARNTGIALATGDWVAFLDHDDMWHCEKLAMTVAYLKEHPECEAVNHPLWFFSSGDESANAFGFRADFVAGSLAACQAAVQDKEENLESGKYLHIRGNSFRLLLERNRGALSASVVKREIALRAGGFCPMQANGEDWTFFLNVARLVEWHTIPRRLAFIRFHGAQDTHKPGSSPMILAGQVNAWLTGRPFPSRLATREDVYRELARYAGEYRKNVQMFWWGALRSGDFRTASLVRQLGALLLPRRRDRWYVLIPPAITWRFERYILGMHK